MELLVLRDFVLGGRPVYAGDTVRVDDERLAAYLLGLQPSPVGEAGPEGIATGKNGPRNDTGAEVEVVDELVSDDELDD